MIQNFLANIQLIKLSNEVGMVFEGAARATPSFSL